MATDHIFSLKELFSAVQLNSVFPDGKTFVDCTPVLPLAEIGNLYNEQNKKPEFDLSTFVNTYFTVPESNAAAPESLAMQPIDKHLEFLWDDLIRQPQPAKDSLINLPHPYIVPGGRFREIYYWDSYFTMLGLQVSRRIDVIQNIVDNFTCLIDQIGYIPNGNRTYYIGRSQPPFYACMINLLREEKGDAVLEKYLPALEKEYRFWMEGSRQVDTAKLSHRRVAFLSDQSILNHYWDENDSPRAESFKEDTLLATNSSDKKVMYRHLRAAAESGWDFSSRWCKDAAVFSTIHTTEIIPVDLNCLLYNLENTIAESHQLSGNATAQREFAEAAEKRKKAINSYCWNEEKKFYVDYDYVAGQQKESLSLAGVFALYFQLATPEQAASVAQVIDTNFFSTGGLVTTLETTGQQWDAPNGWAPLHWIAVQGLAKYGFKKLAENIARRWLGINETVYDATGKMMEKYNVVTSGLEAGGGEYPAQDGFGWTNGVYLALKKWLN